MNRKKSLKKIDRILVQHTTLYLAYLKTRKFYQEYFFRTHMEERKKRETHYKTALRNLRNFENHIPSYLRETFDRLKSRDLPLDKTYSKENHPPSPPSILVEITDPHLLKTQGELDHSSDLQESEGSLKDYENYKNLIKV